VQCLQSPKNKSLPLDRPLRKRRRTNGILPPDKFGVATATRRICGSGVGFMTIPNFLAPRKSAVVAFGKSATWLHGSKASLRARRRRPSEKWSHQQQFCYHERRREIELKKGSQQRILQRWASPRVAAELSSAVDRGWKSGLIEDADG
jgi:hypothetical protein